MRQHMEDLHNLFMKSRWWNTRSVQWTIESVSSLDIYAYNGALEA